MLLPVKLGVSALGAAGAVTSAYYGVSYSISVSKKR